MIEHDEDEDAFEKALATRTIRIEKRLAAANNLARRLMAEGRHDDAVIILEIINVFQQDVIDLAYRHRDFVQRTSERSAKLYALIDQMFENLKNHAHLPEETYNNLTGTLGLFIHKAKKTAASNALNARLLRGSRYPDWMHEITAAEARKGNKASPKRAAEAIADRAATEGYDGDLPEDRTVGRWIKREQARTKRERH